MKKAKRKSPAVLLLVAFAACGDSAVAGAGGATVRDSAGITIVENLTPSWEQGDEWQVSAAPLLEIGSAEGQPHYLLAGVVGTTRLEDGGIAVANAGTEEIRFYDASGAYLRSTGGSGSGPGEFQGIQWMDRFRGDSLVAYDPRSARATVLTSTGDVARTITPATHESGGMPNLLKVLDDGTFIGAVSAPLAADGLTSGVFSTPATYHRLSPADGAFLDSIATLPGIEGHLEVGEGSIMVIRPLLGPAPHVAAAGDAIFLGFGGSFEIRQHASRGALQRLIRRAGARALTETEYRSLLEERLADLEPEAFRQQSRRVLESMPSPGVRPAFASLLGDRAGNLWVEETSLSGEPNRWSVFDNEGRLLGAIDLPDGFKPFEIDDDYVLGVVKDDLDVERVRMYALEKP